MSIAYGIEKVEAWNFHIYINPTRTERGKSRPFLIWEDQHGYHKKAISCQMAELLIASGISYGS